MASQASQFAFPFVDNYDVPGSTFARQHGLAKLPSPDAVRKRSLHHDATHAWDTGRQSKLFLRPPVLGFRDLGLAVKYGHHVSVSEAHCLLFLRQHCPAVPVPEVYAWRRSWRQTFIYMEWVDGTPGRVLGSAQFAQAVLFEQLGAMVQALRSIPQTLVSPTPFIVKALTAGHVDGRPLRSWRVMQSATPVPGVFSGVDVLHDWLAGDFGRRKIAPGQGVSDETKRHRDSLTDDTPIVLTHGDLRLCNVIVAHHNTTHPRIAAILDWGQAGWLPLHWERSVCAPQLLEISEVFSGEDSRGGTVKKEVIAKQETEGGGQARKMTADERQTEAERYTEALEYFTLRADT